MQATHMQIWKKSGHEEKINQMKKYIPASKNHITSSNVYM